MLSLEGPNQLYTIDGPGERRRGLCNWGIRDRHADAVRKLHHAMVLQALAEELQAAIPGMGPKRCFLMAFSQGVGFNFRFVGNSS